MPVLRSNHIVAWRTNPPSTGLKADISAVMKADGSQMRTSMLQGSLSTYRSCHCSHLMIPVSLHFNLVAWQLERTSMKASKAPSGPACARAFPLERKSPVPIIPAKAIMDKLSSIVHEYTRLAFEQKVETHCRS